MNITKNVARHLARLRYESIPECSREAAKKSILDTIGVMTPPSSLDATCQRLFDLTQEESSGGRSFLVGYGAQSSMQSAAFLNGCSVHALDYDDTLDHIAHHPSAQTVPAALAVAQSRGSVSGRDLITAVVAGSDLGARLSSAPNGELGRDFNWFPITNFGVFSATAAAAHILKLDEDQMINALGLALHRCHGELGAVTTPESELRAIRDGFINREGVTCALMAEKGVKACCNALERFFAIYYNNDFDAGCLTKDLGKYFHNSEVSIKPWPSCRITHGYIEGVRSLIAEHTIALNDVSHIVCDVPQGTQDYFCEPEPQKRNPSLSIQAKFSLFFSVAVGAIKKPCIADFLPENLGGPEVLDFISRISSRVSDVYTSHKAVISPALVEIQTHSGASYKSRIDNVYGHPLNPLSEADLLSKFKDCLSYSRQAQTASQIEQLADALLNLDSIKEIEVISELMP